MDSDETQQNPATVAALSVLEELQTTGERDRIKEWLLRELSTRGWVDAMQLKARDLARKHAASGNGPLTAKQLAQQLSEIGHESVPEPVHVKLMAELLRAARTYTAEHAVQANATNES